jgi:hypothetical protein
MVAIAIEGFFARTSDWAYITGEDDVDLKVIIKPQNIEFGTIRASTIVYKQTIPSFVVSSFIK